MPNFTIKTTCIAARSFLEEIKKGPFAFDVISAEFIEGEWEVECEVVNSPGEEAVAYIIRIDDASGEVTYLSRPESDEDDVEDEDMDEEGEAEVEEGGLAPPPPTGGGGGFGGYP